MTFELATRQVPAIMGRTLFDQVFDQLFTSEPAHRVIKRSTDGYPVTDIYYNDKKDQIIEMALAGFKKEDLNIDVEDNTITISYKSNQNDGEARPARRIAKRNFTKTFVDYNNILDFSKTKASFVDGLLSVSIPQVETKKAVSINID